MQKISEILSLSLIHIFTQGRDALEEGRKAAEAAGLPFCERLADGGDDELSPYVYDGSMALTDHEKMCIRDRSGRSTSGRCDTRLSSRCRRGSLRRSLGRCPVSYTHLLDLYELAVAVGLEPWHQLGLVELGLGGALLEGQGAREEIGRAHV